MNPRILFKQFPDAEECFVAGSDAFLKEDDAKSHADHFKLNVKKVLREELEEAPKDEIKTAKPVVSSTDDVEDENAEAESDEETPAIKAPAEATPAIEEAPAEATPATEEAPAEPKLKKGKDA